MKKPAIFAGVALSVAALVLPATAAQAVCANQAIWTQDGTAGQVKKWSTDGELLETIDANIQSSDMAISSDLAHFLAIDSGNVLSYSATTGALESTNTITGDFSDGGAGAGVVAGGKLLADSGQFVYSIDLSTFVSTNWADLTNADASVDVSLRGDSWSVAGDLLQLPDGDILAVANNGTVAPGGVVLVRIDSDSPSTVTVVGIVSIEASVWGAARAGDDIYLATDSGSLLKLDSVPTAASVAPVVTTAIVTDGGEFWGAAGSNDSTEGNATCVEAEEELAETGANTGLIGFAAAALLAAGGITFVARRRNA